MTDISFKRTKFHMHVYVSVLFLLLKIKHGPVSLGGLLGEGCRLCYGGGEIPP